MSNLPERRQVPRYGFSAPARIRSLQGNEGTEVEVRGLGIAGCRIQASQRLIVEREYELTIRPNGPEIITNAVVVHWHQTGFAGLHFTSMSQEARARLESLVDHISRTFTES
jgi:hypothetical protein